METSGPALCSYGFKRNDRTLLGKWTFVDDAMEEQQAMDQGRLRGLLGWNGQGADISFQMEDPPCSALCSMHVPSAAKR